MHIGHFGNLTAGEFAHLQGASLPRGAVRLDTSIGSYDSESMTLLDSKVGPDAADIVWCTPDKLLRIESHWRVDKDTGVWLRRDTLHNDSAKAITIQRILARFLLQPGRYDVYAQSSAWCRENQGAWQPLQAGGRVLRCEGGQTCRGASPFLCLREIEHGAGMAFHVLPRGNWVMRAETHTARQTPLPFVVVELGMDDDHLRLRVPARRAVELPDILFYDLPAGDVLASAPSLHRYLLNRHLPAARMEAPVVYNTWFYVFEWFTVEGLRKQLQAAREAGCEVFVVDAGWFGAGSGTWWEQVGDWREKTDGGFRGRMAEFADEVRAAGLGFGLWMEPERLAAQAPIVREHPDWFLTSDGAHVWPDLENGACYAYILAEMARLITTYGLVWMKVDFNFERGADPTGAEFSGYYRAWYRLQDELRARFPHTFIEGCASGGLRLDLATLSRVDGHFLSDTVNPLDVLRITQGALLRLPPGRITRWCVLSGPRPATAGHPLPRRRPTPQVMTPIGAAWDRSTPATVDFAARVAMPGMFGLSGDLAGLPAAERARLAQHVAFYKKWRSFITGAVAHLLTPPSAIEDDKGWAAIQLQGDQTTTSLVFVYRLNDRSARQRFRLRGLDATATYRLECDERALGTATGRQLMDEGLLSEISAPFGSQVIVIAPA